MFACSNREVAEWSKAHAWKVCIRQKRIEGSNPFLSAKSLVFHARLFISLTDLEVKIILKLLKNE